MPADFIQAVLVLPLGCYKNMVFGWPAGLLLGAFQDATPFITKQAMILFHE
tara:strand:+ start:488 stop:640 length:153 start_codon:yes stop_codon:yes gene_type:complete